MLVLGLIVVIGASLHAAAADRVFTVAEIQQGLARHPKQWIGRTILVRGVFRYAMSDAGTIDIFHPPPYILVTYDLYQPGPLRLGGVSGLPLALKLAPRLVAPRPNPLAGLRDALRRVPGLQRLLGEPALPVFRLTLLAPGGNCLAQGCPQALLDERPW